MGIFSRFENKVEDGLEGAANKVFDAPISPVQISKKAEKAMRREKMVGAGKQYAPTLYTVLVNSEDDKRLFGYYPTLAGETETFLAARAAEEGLTMDGQPLVRFIVDESLRHGKFDVVAELVSAPIVAQLRREEMQRYGLVGKRPQAAPTPVPAAQAPAATPHGDGQARSSSSADFAHRAYADRLAQSQADPADLADPAEAFPKKQPLPYVPEEEIDRSIDYGEYTFNSQDFEDYEEHGPSAQPLHPASGSVMSSSSSPVFDDDFGADFAEYEVEDVASAAPAPTFEGADLSGFDVETYSPAYDSRDFAQAAPTPGIPNTAVFAGGAATPAPDRAAVNARLIDTATNRTYDLARTRLILGRSRSCDIVVDDINASRSHAELRCEPQGVWVLTDLGSTNGTKLNGNKISSVNIAPGDKITIGVTDLVFLLA